MQTMTDTTRTSRHVAHLRWIKGTTKNRVTLSAKDEKYTNGNIL
jgi:hypothetical protein